MPLENLVKVNGMVAPKAFAILPRIAKPYINIKKNEKKTGKNH